MTRRPVVSYHSSSVSVPAHSGSFGRFELLDACDHHHKSRSLHRARLAPPRTERTISSCVIPIWTPYQEGMFQMPKQNTNENPQESAFMSPADLERRWNVSKSLVYKIIHSEGFPSPLRLGTTGANGKSLRFNRAHIEEWERKNTQVRPGR